MAWYWWFAIIAAILIIYSIVRSTIVHEKQKENTDPAITRLKEQLANGEITEEEYHERKSSIKRNT